jgi:hypothetical protein
VRMYGSDPSVWEGSPVHGRFMVDVAVQPQDSYVEESGAIRYLAPGGVVISLNVFGHDMRFGDDDSWSFISLSNAPGRQQVVLAANGAYHPYYHAALSLVGLPGAFVFGNDLDSFHAGPVDVAGSSFGYFADRYSGADIRLASVRFDAVATPVPEPAVWITTLVGLGGLIVHLRRRHANAPDVAPSASPSRPRPYLLRARSRRLRASVAQHMRRIETEPMPLELGMSGWRGPPQT